MSFCIPKQFTDKLKNAAQQGELTIDQIYNATSDERRAIFTKYLPEDLAKETNIRFEKSISSRQKDALSKWVASTIKGEGRKEVKDELIKRVNELDELGILRPESQDEFLKDLVSHRLGATVSTKEAEQIFTKAQKLEEIQSKIGDNFEFRPGEADHNQNLLDYFKSKRDIEDFTDGLNPTSKTKVTLSIIGRGNMLLSAKSTFVNISSNIIAGGSEALKRRIATGKIGGALGSEMKDYMKFANKVYDETGFDITRMMSLSDISKVRQGEKITSTQGPGMVRKAGQFYEDLVFKKMLGKPDVMSSSYAFADSASLSATAIAEKEGLKGEAIRQRAREIFKDATNPDPKTAEGMRVRLQSIKDATYATFTNEAWTSKASLWMRDLINKLTGDRGVGEVVMPFVKTPANVIEAGLDYAGLGAVKALGQAVKAIKTKNPDHLMGAIPNLVRSGVGVTGAFALTSMLKPEDYIGEYPTNASERKLLELKQATANSVKIGDKWVSLDYFGPFGAAFVGMMNAKKYGKESGTAVAYGGGTLGQLTRVPGVAEIAEMWETANKKLKNPNPDVPGEIEEFYDNLVRGAAARGIPAVLKDIAKGTDVQRQTDWKKPVTSLQESIPGWRKGLPEKQNVFGETLEGQGLVSQFLFGARLKSAAKSDVVAEFDRLDKKGQRPALSSLERNERFKSLKEQKGEETYRTALKYFGGEYMKQVDKKIKTNPYKNKSIDEKKKELDAIRTKLVKQTLNKYGYKKPKKDKLDEY